MPGAVEPTVLDVVHRTCKEVAEFHPHVQLNAHKIKAFAQQLELDAAAVKAAGSRASIFPINFESIEEEVNFLCLFHLLDFGSGYDLLLKASSSRKGAAETMQYGCFGLALSAARLDGAWMRGVTPYHIHTTFSIDSTVEEELQPGISISKPGPLAPLSAAILSTITETGKVLGDVGVKSLGAFVMQYLEGLKTAGKSITAASLVTELSNKFPAFQDTAVYTPPQQSPQQQQQQQQQQQPNEVFYLRKAQCLAADLGSRFGLQDERFRWSDADKISADSGAILPSILRQLGIITYSQELAAAIDNPGQQQQQQYLPRGPDEVAIRAAAVTAVDEIVTAVAERSGGSSSGGSEGRSAGFSAWDLSSYLLSLVKEAEGQQPMFEGVQLSPHRTVGTVAY